MYKVSVCVALQEGLQLTEQRISAKLMSKMSEILEGGEHICGGKFSVMNYIKYSYSSISIVVEPRKFS